MRVTRMSESGQSKPPTAVRITDPRNTWSKPLNTGRFLSPFIDTIDAVVLNFQSTVDFPSRDVNPDVARPVSNDKRYDSIGSAPAGEPRAKSRRSGPGHFRLGRLNVAARV